MQDDDDGNADDGDEGNDDDDFADPWGAATTALRECDPNPADRRDGRREKGGD